MPLNPRKFVQAYMRIAAYFVLLLSLLASSSACSQQDQAAQQGVITINNHRFQVEIVATPALRARGLSGRAQLAADHGMYFVFPTAQIRSFWMKEMHFPLDMIWIHGDRIVGITADIPPPADKHAPLPSYASPQPADRVLEINAGLSEAYGLQPGMQVVVQPVNKP